MAGLLCATERHGHYRVLPFLLQSEKTAYPRSQAPVALESKVKLALQTTPNAHAMNAEPAVGVFRMF